MHPTGIIPVGNIPVNDVTDVIPLGLFYLFLPLKLILVVLLSLMVALL